jgi:hypothetical protein
VPNPGPEGLVLPWRRGLTRPARGLNGEAIGVHGEWYCDRDEGDVQPRSPPVMPREVAEPEENEGHRDHPPRQDDGYQVLQARERAVTELQACEVGPHEAAQKPWIGLIIERLSILEHCRQRGQVTPEPLQLKVQVEVDTEQYQGSDPVEAGQAMLVLMIGSGEWPRR